MNSGTKFAGLTAIVATICATVAGIAGAIDSDVLGVLYSAVIGGGVGTGAGIAIGKRQQ